jgi:hypothetical protein
MKKTILIILIAITAGAAKLDACNVCGGGTDNVFVLALDGKALFNASFLRDYYLGVWDGAGIWHPSDYSQTQTKTILAVAYRINSHMQFAVSLPYVMNNRNTPGLKPSGSGIGDMQINGRYEFFHEFQLKKVNGKPKLDNVMPYLAFTFGLTLPTGVSTENASSEIDVTGKGFYTTSVGVSLIKSLIKNRLQLSTDLTWQHSFERTFDKEYNIPTSPYKKQQGDKFNYSASLNYIFSSEHALTASVSGYSQSQYSVNSFNADNSQERNLTFAAAYTFYPTLQFRITPSVKWVFTGDNLGRNATGSTTLMLSLTYYIPETLNKK